MERNRWWMMFPLGIAAALGSCQRPAPVDLTKALGFSDPAACIVMPQGEHAFEDMLHGTDEDGGMKSDAHVDLAGRDFPVRSSADIDRKNESFSYRAEVVFPAGSRWHDLKVVAIGRGEDFVLGKDGTHARWFQFSEPLARVGAVIQSMNVPLDAGNSAALEILDGRSCEGSLSLRRTKSGTEMRCEWGC